MESLGVGKGFVLFRRSGPMEARSMSFDVKDRVQVFVDENEVATVYRGSRSPVDVPRGRSLELLVENMGHLNFGPNLGEQKGLSRFMAEDGDWTATCLPMDY